MTRGKVLPEEELKWNQATRGSRLLFGQDVADYIEELFKKVTDLQLLDAMSERLGGDQRAKNYDQQQEIKGWFRAELRNLENRFSCYLQLRH